MLPCHAFTPRLPCYGRTTALYPSRAPKSQFSTPLSHPSQLAAAGSNTDQKSDAASTDLWLQELQNGTLWKRAEERLPTVTWQPKDLVTVMAFSMAGGGLFFAANDLLLHAASPGSDPISLVKAVAAAVADQPAPDPEPAAVVAVAEQLLQATAPEAASLHDLLGQYAQLHLAQEALLSLLLPGAVVLALRPPAADSSPRDYNHKQTTSQVQQLHQSTVVKLDESTQMGNSNAANDHQQQQQPQGKGVAGQELMQRQQEQQHQHQQEQLRQPLANEASGKSQQQEVLNQVWTSPLQLRWDGGSWFGQTLLVCSLAFPLADPVLHSVWEPLTTSAVGPPPVNALASALHLSYLSGDFSSLWMNIAASGLLGPIWEEVFWRGFVVTAMSKVLPLPLCVLASSCGFAALHLSPANSLPLLLLGAAADVVYLRSGANLLASYVLHALWNTTQVLAIALLGKESFV